jgi:hypothetical protein
VLDIGRVAGLVGVDEDQVAPSAIRGSTSSAAPETPVLVGYPGRGVARRNASRHRRLWWSRHRRPACR